MASTDARLVPQKNVAFRVTFPLYDADGDLVTGATSLDSEVSKDGGTFADCTNEATEIATSSGMYYLDLTSSEMNADTVAVIVKSASAKTLPLVFYPDEAGDIRADTVMVSGDATAADNLEAMLDGTGGVDLTLRKVTVTATSNDNALTLTGSGTGSGILATGGATGHGISGVGGATSGNGIKGTGSNGNSAGVNAVGQGSAAGLQATGGATGAGVQGTGGASSGAGIAGVGTAGNSTGLAATGQGSAAGLTATGGATGAGLKAVGGGTSGDGISASVTGASNNGMTLAGGASGVGLSTTILGTLANTIADYIIRRSFANAKATSGPDTKTGRSLLGVVARLTNKNAVAAGTLTVYEEDDTTSLFTAGVTTTAGNPITTIDP